MMTKQIVTTILKLQQMGRIRTNQVKAKTDMTKTDIAKVKTIRVIMAEVEMMKMKTTKNNGKKVVIITGASSGIGLATSKYFVQRGCTVYGLSRKIFEETGIISLSCDVTNKEQGKE